jgi:hypothetical protein
VLIVLEGVDLGGKSALARALDEISHPAAAVILHQGPPPLNVDLVEHYERPLLDPNLLRVIRDPDDLVILDRWETGELVYGPLYRDGSRLSLGQALHVDLLLRSLGAVRVLAQPRDVDVVIERHDRIGDDVLKRRDVAVVHGFYEAYAERRGWYRGSARHALSAVNEGPAYYPDDLLHLAERQTLDAFEFGGFPSYLGPRWPKALLVGERRADGPRAVPGGWTTHPFTPLGRNSCGQWLLDALESADLLDVGLANAHEPGQDLVKLWQTLARPRLVALGAVASVELRRLGLEHGRVNHPQYERRFRRSQFGSYVKRLREEARANDGDRVPAG